MSFLTFLGYFMVSMFLWKMVCVGVNIVASKFFKWRLNGAIKSGKIKMISMEDLLDKIQEEKGKGDGSWH